jgi:hypothetical protein
LRTQKDEVYVKNFERGWLCLTLLLCGWVTPGAAQQQPPQPSTPAADPSVSATSQPQDNSTPAVAAAPAQDVAPQDNQAQPTPTAQPTPANQSAPPQQAPPTPVAPPQDQPTGQTNIKPLPPPMPKVPDVRMPGETGLWIGFTGWFPDSGIAMDRGHDSYWTYYSRVIMQGNPKLSEGLDAGLALGLHNAIKFSWFEARAAGDLTPNIQTYLWGMLYPNGTLLSTDYRLQDLKLSFDYLTWPYPVESRRFRLKTLYQIQYIGIRTGFDNPTLPLYDSNGNPLLNSQGNPISYATEGSKWYVTPTLGFGTEYWKSKRFRLETDTTAFAIPHHSTTLDGEVSANWRFGHWELKAGVKAFHFKTSPTSDYFMRGTLYSGLVGIRWYSD